MSVTGFDPHSHKLLCSRFVASGQWERALEAAREWLAQEPENPLAHMYAGQSLLVLKRPAEAEKHLRCVLAAQPENDVAHRFLSMVQFEQKRYREADESIQKAIALDPHDFYHWFHLASMFYHQGDLASARKYAKRARELNPEDSDIVNLLALCEPREPGHSLRRLEQYHEALELDPESPEVHNNIGVHYLNEAKDYAKAEECFRTALFFNPALQVARANLFITLKHRDRVYRCLCAPKDFLLQGFSFMGQKRRQNLFVYILLLPLWFLAIRYVLAGLLLWCLLVWPMVKTYEKLTIGDIRAAAGEIGARRGGFLGYRRWSLKARLAIFAGLLVTFWSGIGWGVYQCSRSATDEANETWLGLVLFCALIGFVIFNFRRIITNRRVQYHARRRGRRFAGVLGNEPQKRKWWQLWPRRSE